MPAPVSNTHPRRTLTLDYRFLNFAVQTEIQMLIADDISWGEQTPLTPAVVQEVLEGSGPVEDFASWSRHSMRDFVARELCKFKFCTTVNFSDYATCFELDGGLAAELMVYIADETKWALKSWQEEADRILNFDDLKEEWSQQDLFPFKKVDGWKHPGVWDVLRVMCTSAGCTSMDLRGFAPLFELNGTFASGLLDHMAAELRWFIEQWGCYRNERIDVAEEKEKQEHIESMVLRSLQRI